MHMPILFMSTRIIGTMISRFTLLPEQFHEKIRELLLSAQFRSYETVTQQIDSQKKKTESIVPLGPHGGPPALALELQIFVSILTLF